MDKQVHEMSGINIVLLKQVTLMELYIFRFHLNFSFSNLFAFVILYNFFLCKTVCVDLIEVKFMIYGDEFTYVHYCWCRICVVHQLIQS